MLHLAFVSSGPPPAHLCWLQNNVRETFEKVVCHSSNDDAPMHIRLSFRLSFRVWGTGGRILCWADVLLRDNYTKTTTSVTSHTILQTSTSSFTPLSIPVRSYWVVVLSSPSNTKKQSVANINITREKSSPETPASICHSILKTTSAEISASTTCKRFTYTLSHWILLYAKDTAQSRQQMRSLRVTALYRLVDFACSEAIARAPEGKWCRRGSWILSHFSRRHGLWPTAIERFGGMELMFLYRS